MTRHRTGGSQRQAEDVVTEGPPDDPSLPGRTSDRGTRAPIPSSTGAPPDPIPKLQQQVRRQTPQGDPSTDFDVQP
jgi:hypothetical protein